MPSEPEDFALDLYFTEVDCESCGQSHPLALGCRHCGTDPVPDPHVTRRTEIVADALDILDLSVAAPPASTIQPYLEDSGPLGEWISRLSNLLVLVCDEQDVAVELQAHVQNLVAWRDELAAAPRLRPSLWRLDLLRASVASLIDATRAFLRGMVAPNGDSALSLWQTANESIAAANELLEDAVERLARRSRTTASDAADSNELLIRMAEELARDIDIHADAEIPADIAAIYTQITGDAECPVTPAVSLTMAQVQIDLLADRDRFWKCAGITYRRLTSTVSRGCAKFGEVIAHDGWFDHFHEMHRELQMAGGEFQTLLRSENPERQVRALIRFGHVLAERLSPFLLATVLAAYKDRDYGELIDVGFGDLLGQARDVRLETLLLGLDKALRHADAHGRLQRIDVENQIVYFTAEQREYDSLTFNQLIDRVLAGWESAHAMLTGVIIALINGGHTDKLRLFDDLGFTIPERVDFILAAMGWTDRHVSLDGATLRIEANVDPDLKLIGAVRVIAHELDAAENIELSLQRGDVRETWQGPTTCFTNNHATAEPGLAMAWVMRRWQHNGAPAIDRSLARIAFARTILARLVEVGDVARVRPLVVTGAFIARQLDDHRLIDAVLTLVRFCNDLNGGQATDTQWRRATGELTRLGASEARPLPRF
ncbi:hypothetical protein [Glycomyces xiaoerkulensis]|uniref:hypothetical protein n=1 Tax=Glycomyces xiaoerkulensis TaxID=2038139 RepID=UPI0018E48717|nr:hypothetical protein [Glycomyces xiaoerkulensis]